MVRLLHDLYLPGLLPADTVIFHLENEGMIFQIKTGYRYVPAFPCARYCARWHSQLAAGSAWAVFHGFSVDLVGYVDPVIKLAGISHFLKFEVIVNSADLLLQRTYSSVELSRIFLSFWNFKVNAGLI